MRNKLLLAASIALTILCWGTYGPVLQMGQIGNVDRRRRIARLRPFVCVGLAYFLVGVIVPAVWLHFKGEKGDWTLTGIVWSLAGGALGAIGALGIILAFTFGGAPVYVMPLVFGGAPVINAFLTIYLARRMKEIGPTVFGRPGDGHPWCRDGAHVCPASARTCCGRCTSCRGAVDFERHHDGRHVVDFATAGDCD